MRAIRIISLLALGAGAGTIAATAAVRPGVASAVAQAAPAQQGDIAYIGNGRLLSNIVKVGNTLYLSGVLGNSGERGITPETKAAMERIKTLLEANGSHMDDIVKCTVFLADFADWQAMNEVYLPYFTKHRPARSAIAVAGMSGNARVEIECIAVIGARNAS
jgi:2-iminobutanoate/2-iminopropanoate deaminase